MVPRASGSYRADGSETGGVGGNSWPGNLLPRFLQPPSTFGAPTLGRPTVFKTHPRPAGPQAPWMARVMGVGAGPCCVGASRAGASRAQLRV